MEKLIECMLNEGINEETIINVVEEYLNEDTISFIKKKKEPILKKSHENAMKALNKEGKETYNKIMGSSRELDKEMIQQAFAPKEDQGKLEHLNNLLSKAYDIKRDAQKQIGNPDRRSSIEKGSEKTESRRYMGGNEVPSYHIGELKGYSRNKKSPEQRTQEKLGKRKQNASESFNNVIELVEGLLGLNEDIHSAIDKFAPEKRKKELHQKVEDIQTKDSNEIYDRDMKKLANLGVNSYTKGKSTLPKALIREINKNPKTKLAFIKGGWTEQELSQQAAPLGKETKAEKASEYHGMRQKKAKGFNWNKLT